MDISVEQRAEILALHEHTGRSITEISVDVGVEKSSVSRIIALDKVTGSFATSRKGHCGQKRKTTAHDDKTLVRNSVINPGKTRGYLVGIWRRLVYRWIRQLFDGVLNWVAR